MMLRQLTLLLTLLIFISACNQNPTDPDPEPVYGCTNEHAPNYNPNATVDDGSCTSIIYGCTDTFSLNFNPIATDDDGSCLYPTSTIPLAIGNQWILTDAFEVPLLGEVDWYAVMSITGDTTINGEDYFVMEEVIGNPGIEESFKYYAYRQDYLGRVFRIDFDDASLQEYMFLDYPLEVGKQWFDHENEDHYLGEVTAINTIETFVGPLEETRQIKYTQLWDATTFEVFVTPEVGIGRINTVATVAGFPFDVELLLESYTVK